MENLTQIDSGREKAPVSKEKRKRGRAPKLPQGPVEASKSRNLRDDQFFSYVEGRPDKSNADVTVYRVVPKIDSKLNPQDTDPKKSLDIVPAAEFSREWLSTRHGYGLYRAFFNDAGDKAAFCQALIDLRKEAGLYDEMMDPAKCKIDLRTVVECEANAGYIKAWKVRGMWPGEREDDIMDATAVKVLGDLAGKALEGGAAKPAAGADLTTFILPLMLKMLDKQQAPAGVTPEQMQAFGRQIAAETAAAIKADMLAAENAKLQAEVERLRKEKDEPSDVLGQLKRIGALKKLAKQLAGDETPEEDDDSFLSLVKNYGGPLVKNLLAGMQQQQQQQPAAAPIAAAPVSHQHNPAPAAPAAGEDPEVAIVRGLLSLFLRGRSPEYAAEWLCFEQGQEQMFDLLKAQGVPALMTLLRDPTTQIGVPEAAEVLQRQTEFAAWAEEALNTYDQDDNEPAAEPAVEQGGAAAE